MGFFKKNQTTEEVKDKQEAETPGLFGRLGGKLASARASLGRNLGDLLLGKREIDDALLEELETLLLRADVGVDATQEIIDQITDGVHRRELSDAEAVYEKLREILVAILAPRARSLVVTGAKPFTIMVVGVNGAGKTTTIGKLTHKFKQQGAHIMLAAADTFRAAAVEQLHVWADRTGTAIVSQPTGSDAASVAHDAIRAAAARGIDILIVDTAGRLHTQSGLMDELKKIKRVMAKAQADAPHEVLLILDGSIGQNALAQLAHFDAAVGITGLCITKLDGTAKGGVLFAIAKKTQTPIRYIGIGESVDDLRDFDAREYVEALLPPDMAQR